MKISSNNWSVKDLEKAYQQVSHKVPKPDETNSVEKYSRLSKIKGVKKSKNLVPADILSKEEKITLKRLFEYDMRFNFYGKSNTQKALSGILLDVTG